MKTSSLMLSAAAGSVLAVLAMTAPVEAKKLGDWTCYDFIKAPKSTQSRVVYFFQGIKLSDKKDALDLAAKDFDVPVSKVVQHCQRNHADNLWDAIANHFYWSAMQIP
ncbi:MAG TPA: HdeA/HdeB family chaperone [Methylocella sp.]|nr:HdeA/HdeB family chaperone [Methylocella sp.]